MKTFDLVIKNARVVRPKGIGADALDIGIKGGKVVKLAPETGDSHPIYDAYFTHFNDAYNTGATL